MRPRTFEHCFYHLLSMRYDLSTNDQLRLARLNKGYEGECQLDHSLITAGFEHRLLRDLWLPAHGSQSHCQIDALLLLDTQYLIIECKHFSGHFRYDGYRSLLNQRPYQYDIVAQLERQKAFLQQWLDSSDYCRYPIRGFVVFTDDQVQLDQVPAHFLTWRQWLDYLASTPISATTSVANHPLANCQFKNSTPPRMLDPLEQAGLTKGIQCLRCQHPRLTASRYKLRCPHCGLIEDKSHAYYRTLCEFAVLYHDRPVTLEALQEFCGPEASQTLLRKTLLHYTTCVRKGNKAPHIITAPHLKWHQLVDDLSSPLLKG